MSDQPGFDIGAARAAIADAEALLESETPARAEIIAALSDLRADIANGERPDDSLRALRVVLARASSA
jgi:hypothetical protein